MRKRYLYSHGYCRTIKMIKAKKDKSIWYVCKNGAFSHENEWNSVIFRKTLTYLTCREEAVINQEELGVRREREGEKGDMEEKRHGIYKTNSLYYWYLLIINNIIMVFLT